MTGYFLFYPATPFKLVNSFFSYTSWARFLMQYREPGTTLKDLMAKVGLGDEKKPLRPD